MTISLKDGQTTLDPRLDRVRQFDHASRAFPVRDVLAATKPRSYTWSCQVWLDQGQQGSCVGHAWAHEVAARPRPRPADSALAVGIYRRAQQLDDWPGEEPAYSGTSVLAGAKATKEMGYLTEYRWALGGLDDLVLAVGYKGPAILGIDWLEQMSQTDQDGVIHATGEVLGGHAILCHGVDVKRRLFRLRNSWGVGWGVAGDCYIGFADMEMLLHQGGEACIPVIRT